MIVESPLRVATVLLSGDQAMDTTSCASTLAIWLQVEVSHLIRAGMITPGGNARLKIYGRLDGPSGTRVFDR